MNALLDAALLLDLAAASTPRTELIPALCLLKRAALDLADPEAVGTDIAARCRRVLDASEDPGRSPALPGLMRAALFALLLPGAQIPAEPEALRERCCLRAEQLRAVGSAREAFSALWRLWPEAIAREEQTAFDAQAAALAEELDGTLALCRAAIAARDAEARAARQRDLSLIARELPDEETGRRAELRARARVEWQRERFEEAREARRTGKIFFRPAADISGRAGVIGLDDTDEEGQV